MADTLAIIPTYLRTEQDMAYTFHAVKSLLATSNADLLVVDDGSPNRDLVDQLGQLVEDVGADFSLSPDNQGFARSVNVGIREARRTERHALLVNADIQFWENDWLDHMRANPADVVGGLLIYPNGLIQHAGIFFSVITRKFGHILWMAPGTLEQAKQPRFCPVTGALQLIKHETIKKIGVYDENFRLGYEDVDYCHMVFQAGMKCAVEPQAIAVHHESAFRIVINGKSDPKHVKWMEDGWIYFHEKHRGRDFGEYTPTLLWEEA